MRLWERMIIKSLQNSPPQQHCSFPRSKLFPKKKLKKIVLKNTINFKRRFQDHVQFRILKKNLTKIVILHHYCHVWLSFEKINVFKLVVLPPYIVVLLIGDTRLFLPRVIAITTKFYPNFELSGPIKSHLVRAINKLSM